MPQRFPDPFDVETPEGAEGWEEMYSYYHLYGEERKAQDTQQFWFQDRLHHPRALYPYDEIQCECWWQALGAFNTRIFSMPPAFGVDQRVLNGYLYVSPVPAPADQIEARAEEFGKRASHYYDNWDAIYEEWKDKVNDRLATITALDFSALPDQEDMEVVTSHRGTSSGYQMIESFSTLVTTMYETYQFHFELLNIGYAAYLTFFGFCKEAFPDIPDQTISRMVGGLHVDLYRPDDELKRLAKEAVRLEITEQLRATENPDALFEELRATDAGGEWVTDYTETSDPWFLFNTDPGHPGGYHVYPTWKDDPRLPLGAIRDYIDRIEAGEDLARPTEKVLAERDRITAEYTELLAPDDVGAFEEMVALARKVFVYIEEHVLYIEHWMWATFWAKSKELAATLAAMGSLDDAEDMFYLRRSEVADLIYDTVAAWSVGAQARGAGYWSPIVAKRRAIYDVLDAYDAPEALGPPPAEVTEPFTVMLWGITTDTVAEWLADDDDGDGRVLKGIAGSPGVVEGRARVVKRVEELDAVEQGEVLICPATSPSWSTIFGKIAATVSDVGGIMSHAAIVCREYGMPAVVGTGKAVSTIQTGQMVRVDGDNGTVTVLDG